MKKDYLILLGNIVCMILVVALVINYDSLIAKAIKPVSSNVISVFSQVNELAEVTTDKNDNNDNDSNTTSKKETDNKKITVKDSDLFSNITETPTDIAKLMAEEEKNIKKEKVKGKTSEEDYFGGGTLVSFSKVEIQSKIPESFYKPNIEKLLKQKADLSIQDISKPTVLVYHSHTTESYTLLDVGYYTKSTDLRSNSEDRNMVRVGDELCEYLKKQGIGVIHDRKIHDTNYTGAYGDSRKSVEKYLEKYPTIEITIDVHRDDITYDNKTKVKPTAVINGKKAARMMIIAGCEYGSVKNFPDWEYNLRFDLAVQNKVNEMYEGLMRPVLFAERKYNMYETRNSFLLEVGTDGNTLDEACYSARLFATSLGELIKEDYLGK